VYRKAPDNIGWTRSLYDGPGTLRDREASIEDFLAREVETPAAIALREFASSNAAQQGIPPSLSRYLAWAAARSLPMATLYEAWLRSSAEGPVVEAPPDALMSAEPVFRTHAMRHPVLGDRDDVATNDVEALRGQGWELRLVGDDLTELMHLQAWYFQLRHFPRMKWIVLRAPPGTSFVIGDRPIAWSVAGRADVPPAALRHPEVQLLAPLSRSVALFAHHEATTPPSVVSVVDVNRAVVGSAHDWIAGASEATVRSMIEVESTPHSPN
jgi:hypothetical protein